ncbi:MAG TPA: nodulation protein NfeD [Polyangiaceae bacterium]|jgi:membrane-bound serine protease (ClpP class)
MRGARLLILWLACLSSLATVTRSARAADAFVELRISGVINPVKARLVSRAVTRARAEHAKLLLVSLDTPGGLVGSMEEIVTALTNAGVPVVTFVSPRSAQASSAGAFILLAGDVAAMAPGTRTGAAHPVGEGGKAIEGPLNDKVTNSLSSLVRSLAERRNRPSAEAEAMVRESTSYTAEQAYDKKLIELIEPNDRALLDALDGREVAGHALHTQNLEQIAIAPSAFETLLDHLADPTLTSLLLSVGMLGILYELATPGIGAGGAIGALCLVLGLLGSSVLSIELSAVALLLIGVAALALEVKVPTHGVLAGAGVVAILFGGMLLVDQGDYFGGARRVNPALFLPVVVLAAGLVLLATRAARKVLSQPPLTGVEALVGKVGEARSSFGAEAAARSGTVFVDGARWPAESSESIVEGERVLIESVLLQPTRLVVRRVT